jgi:hypothetical protein
MIVYNSDYVLGESLRSVLPYGKMIITEGPCGYWRDHPNELVPDRTRQILYEHMNYGKGIHNICSGMWDEKDQMSNAGMMHVPEDTTHMFVVDSDEVWRQKDIEKIIDLIKEHDFDSMAFTADSFFGGFDHILGGFERKFPVIRVQRFYPGARWATHRPPTIVSPLGKPWAQCNHATHEQTLEWGITMPHYSYVFLSQAVMKHKYYTNYSPGMTIPGYINSVFRPWACGNDQIRQEIEDRWNGVHNFVPAYRGECRTMPFEGEHPEEILKSWDHLKTRLRLELVCEKLNFPRIQNKEDG